MADPKKDPTTTAETPIGKTVRETLDPTVAISLTITPEGTIEPPTVDPERIRQGSLGVTEEDRLALATPEMAQPGPTPEQIMAQRLPVALGSSMERLERADEVLKTLDPTRLPKGPARKGKASTSEAVRDVGKARAPADLKAGVEKGAGETTQRIKDIIAGKARGVTGVPLLDAAAEALSLPSTAMGTGLTEVLTSAGIDLGTAQAIGTVASIAGAVGYGAVTPMVPKALAGAARGLGISSEAPKVGQAAKLWSAAKAARQPLDPATLKSLIRSVEDVPALAKLAEQGGAWPDLAMKVPTIRQWAEEMVAGLAARAGVDPAMMERALAEGHKLARGPLRSTVDPVKDSLIAQAKELDLPGIGKSAALALGVSLGMVLAELVADAEREGGITGDHIEARLGPNVAANRQLKRVLMDVVRRLRAVPGKIGKITTADVEQAEKMLHIGPDEIRVGRKLMAIQWDAGGADMDKVAATIQKIKQVFDVEGAHWASRGTVTWAAEREMTEQLTRLGFDAEVVIAKWKEGGRAVSSTEIMATASLLEASIKRLTQVGDAVLALEGRPEYVVALQQYTDQLGMAVALAQTLDGQAEEAGRALAVMRALTQQVPPEMLSQLRQAGEAKAAGLPSELDVGRIASGRETTALKSDIRAAVEAAVDLPEGAGRSALRQQIDQFVDMWEREGRAAPPGPDSAKQLAASVVESVRPYRSKQRTFEPEPIRLPRPWNATGARTFEPDRPAPAGDPLLDALGEAVTKAARDWNEGVPRRALAADSEAMKELQTVVSDMIRKWNHFATEGQKASYLGRLATWGLDLFRENWYNTMLSQLPTHVANTVGNAQAAVEHPLILALASGIGAARQALGLGSPEVHGAGEALAVVNGYLSALTEGVYLAGQPEAVNPIFAAGKAFYTGESAFASAIAGSRTSGVKVPRAMTGARVQYELDLLNVGQLPDPLYHAVNVLGSVFMPGTRALTAEDELAKMVQFNAEIHRLAYIASQNLPAAERGAAMATFIKSPPPEAVKAAKAQAHYLTFTAPHEGTMAAISHVARTPLVMPLVPFFDTLVNLAKYEMSHVPGLALAIKDVRRKFATRGPEMDEELAKWAIGSAVGAITAQLYLKGRLTGRGPSDPKDRQMLEQTEGWQDHAMVFDIAGKKHFVGINRADPWARVLFAVPTAMDSVLEALNGREVSWDTAKEVIIAATLGIKDEVLAPNFIQGFREFLEISMASDLDGLEKARRWATATAASLKVGTYPGGAWFNMMNRIQDPYQRAALDYVDEVNKRLPWHTDKVARTWSRSGHPNMLRPALGGRWLSPYGWTTYAPDPVTRELRDNGVTIAPRINPVLFGSRPPWIGEETPSHGIMPTPEQYERMQQLSTIHFQIPRQPALDILNLFSEGKDWSATVPDRPMTAWQFLTHLVQTKRWQTDDSLTPGPNGRKAKIMKAIIGMADQAAEMMMLEDPAIRRQYLIKQGLRAEEAAGPKARRLFEGALRQGLPEQTEEGVRELRKHAFPTAPPAPR